MRGRGRQSGREFCLDTGLPALKLATKNGVAGYAHQGAHEGRSAIVIFIGLERRRFEIGKTVRLILVRVLTRPA